METDTPDTIFCSACGVKNLMNHFTCVSCGARLHPAATAVVDDSITSLIPYTNAKALASYYLGIFGLIPFLGLPLALAALILGILGLRYARLHPRAKGRGHAWAGIILGGLVMLFSVAVIGFAVVANAFD